MITKYGDIISGVFLLIVAIVVYNASYDIKELVPSRVGSGFVPRVISVLLSITSLTIIIKGIRNIFAKPASKGEERPQAEQPKTRVNAVIATFALITAYIASMAWLGFLLSTAIYLFLQFIVLAPREQRKIPMFACVSVVSAVVIYYLFVDVFHLMLPAGLLG